MAAEIGFFSTPETNIFAPENGWLEYFLVSFWDGLFSGAFAVSFRECLEDHPSYSSK